MSLDWTVGQHLTASRLNRRLPVTASKLGPTPRASTTTFAADPDLVLSLKADTTYDIHGLLLLSGGDAGGDFKRAWSWTNTATVTKGGAGGANSIASGTAGSGDWQATDPDSSSPADSTTFSYFASATVSGAFVNDRVVVGSVDITLTLTWAQQNSSVTATVLRGGSFVTAIPVA